MEGKINPVCYWRIAQGTLFNHLLLLLSLPLLSKSFSFFRAYKILEKEEWPPLKILEKLLGSRSILEKLLPLRKILEKLALLLYWSSLPSN